MAIPDFQTIMLPLLKYLGDHNEHHLRDAVEALAAQFELRSEERKELLPSGAQYTFDNRVGWARTYLKKAGLIQSTKRGYFKISDLGIAVLKEEPKEINVRYLKRFPDFIKFQLPEKENEGESADDKEKKLLNPAEAIEAAYLSLHRELSAELLQAVKETSPGFFERLVVDLLVAMGYGGTRKDAGEAIGKSGDEGIDGIIKEDRLGLDIVYVQAKKWENPVGRPEIQKFAGALQGQRAKKGIFITTSSFTKDAIDYATRIESKIVLIDGNKLTDFMIDNSIGVAMAASYEIKKIDQDYFIED